MMTKHPTHPA